MELPIGALDFAPNKKGLKIFTPSGYQDFAGVAFMGDKPIWRINLSNSGFLECTDNHRLYGSDGVEYQASELTRGVELFTLEETPIKVTDVFDTGRVEAVYDVIDVQGGHLFYTNGVVSHNCKFVSEDETLINPLVLANLTSQEPLFKLGQGSSAVRWFAEPKANHIYGVTLDPSMGTGGDFSAIQIFDFTAMEQVAEWRHNKTITQYQIDILRKNLLYIHYTLLSYPEQEVEPEIYWTVENNSLGEAALVQIDNIGEENFPGVFVHEPKKSGGGRGRKGLNTNTRSKISACSRMKTLIETNRMKIKSRALLYELKNFVRGGGSYKGKAGVNDDLVMGLLQITRLLQICADWEEQIEDNLRFSSEDDDSNFAPMPIVI